jgi:hypothetical protein
MSKISIEQPFELELDLIEVEDRLPSFKTLISLKIGHPTGFFKYQANDIWFECSKWDLFIKELMSLSFETTATLEDMSEQFKFIVEKKSDNQFICRCICFEPEATWGKANLSFSVTIDSDKLSSLIRVFDEFPRWW